MCNCNSKRSMYSMSNDSVPEGMVKVKLTESNPRVLNGDITGRTYIFRNINDINMVDKRDAISMREIKGIHVF